jgi:hypothetical protein
MLLHALLAGLPMTQTPDLTDFRDAISDDRRNRMLLAWLADDKTRAALFKLTNANGGRLCFPSRDATPRHCDCDGFDEPVPAVNPRHAPVTLVTDRVQIEEILLDTTNYSNRVYSELGGGNFMLAIDPGPLHTAPREAFSACFPHSIPPLLELAHAACQSASVLGLRGPDFDLAQHAEQAGLRFCQLLFGYSATDFPLLEAAIRAGYKALVYQVMERHFITDPTLIPTARMTAAKLLTRTSALIDAYESRDDDVLKGCDDPSRPGSVSPVLKELALLNSAMNGEQRAHLALGSAIGTVGNVQAAVCIAVKALFASPDSLLTKARALARSECDGASANAPTGKMAEWIALLSGPLRDNPPIAYLPRISVDRNGRKTGEFLLALGGGSAQYSGRGDDPLVWGLPKQAKHWCAGQALAWPLIVEVVRQVIALPHLAQGLDPADATVKGLEKRHGFACTSYPLTYRRDRRRAQWCLNVAMRIKSPVRENADQLRQIIRAGAPRIERVLRESRHVHFAWFELIESDTVLVLHTVYDGPFDAYVQHFALRAGDLFDALFSCIEDPPPMPVDKFPHEFAAHLRRYDRAPALGYFFSAYPGSEVARIVRDEARGP